MSSTILIVDDDEVLSRVLERILRQQGYTVLHAGSVAQAVQLDAAHRPELGLLDLCLPDGDGVQLAETLGAQHPGLPLILMTAYPLRLRDHPEGAARFAQVLTKPVDVSALRQAIEGCLPPHAGGAVPARPAVSRRSEVPAGSFFRD